MADKIQMQKIRAAGRGASLAAGLAILGWLGGCGTVPRVAEERLSFEQPQMGVPFRILLYARNREQARAAAEVAFARIAELNWIFSDYEDESEASRLSRSSGSGEFVRVSPEMWTVLTSGMHLSARTRGAFDATVGPLVQLWRRARRQREMPEPDMIAEAKTRVGFIHLEMDPSRRAVCLRQVGMRLDFGAIAKGYAVDEALRVLRELGFPRALVSGGGDLAIGIAPPGQPGWRVELPPLDAAGAPATRFLSLTNCGFATSGDFYQHMEIGGKRYSHIVDPRSGLGLTDHSQVVVLARNCRTADSLATAVSVLGPKDGRDLVESFPGAFMRVVRKPAEKIEEVESTGFARHYVRGKPMPERPLPAPPKKKPAPPKSSEELLWTPVR